VSPAIRNSTAMNLLMFITEILRPKSY
jgi:hypothetical protein